MRASILNQSINKLEHQNLSNAKELSPVYRVCMVFSCLYVSNWHSLPSDFRSPQLFHAIFQDCKAIVHSHCNVCQNPSRNLPQAWLLSPERLLLWRWPASLGLWQVEFAEERALCLDCPCAAGSKQWLSRQESDPNFSDPPCTHCLCQETAILALAFLRSFCQSFGSYSAASLKL